MPADLVFYKHDGGAFLDMMVEYPKIRFFNPSPELAPWHIQAKVNGWTLNFWPHKNKSNIESEKSRFDLGREVINEALVRSPADDPVVDLYHEAHDPTGLEEHAGFGAGGARSESVVSSEISFDDNIDEIPI